MCNICGQTLFLFCLTVTAVCATPYAEAAEKAVAYVTSSSDTVASVLTLIAGSVVPLVALVASYAVPVFRGRCAKCFSRSG